MLVKKHQICAGRIFFLDFNSENCNRCDQLLEDEIWETFNLHQTSLDQTSNQTSIFEFSLKCGGAYQGRKTCRDGTYLKQPEIFINDDNLVQHETTEATCVKCLVLPKPSDHYVDMSLDARCGSFWNAANGLLVSSASEITKCDNNEECPKNNYIICLESSTCSECTLSLIHI